MVEVNDWYKNHLKKTIENGISSGEFNNTSFIYCPYCGHRQKDYNECLPRHAEDWGTAECEKCLEEFLIMFDYVYNTKKRNKLLGSAHNPSL